MSYRLPLRLEKLQREIKEAPQILERLGMDDTLTIRLVAQVRVAILCDLDKANDLVVAQSNNRIIYATLVESEPIIMRLAVGPYAESIAIDADSRPLPKPRSYFAAGTYFRKSLGF